MIEENGKTSPLNGSTKKVVIQGRYYGDKTFPSLNNYLAEIGKNPRAGGRMKKDYMWVCISAIRKYLKGWKVTKPPIIIHYKFYEPSKGQKRDVSNIYALVDKFFEDALQAAGTIENDNPAWVANTTHEFYYTDSEPYIEIEIEERG